MNRRQFLKAAGKVAIGATLSMSRLGAGTEQTAPSDYSDDLDRYDFVMPRVKFSKSKGSGPDRWNVRPGGDANLLDEFSTVIRCKTKPIKGATDWEPQYAREGQLNAVVTFDKLDELRKFPFLFMTGENYFKFDENQKHNLKEYIMGGGFLFMDDCVVGSGGDFFYQSSYQVLEETFGSGCVSRISREHEIFHNVYDLGETGLPSMEYVRRPRPGGLPYMHGQNHGARGVLLGDRIAVFLGSTDLHCGWCDRHGLTWGRHSYEKAIQMGINIIMYAISH